MKASSSFFGSIEILDFCFIGLFPWTSLRLRQFLESVMVMDQVDCYCWNSSGSFFYGSILSNECVDGHVLTLRHLADFIQKAWPFRDWDSFWWTVIAETPQDHSFVDPYFILSNECVVGHVWTLRHPKHPQISLDLTLCPQKNHGHFETETVFGVCHGSSGLLLLKLLRIILLWIHTVHWMCRCTCLDLSVVPQFRMCLVLIGMRWRIADTIINLSRSQVVLKFCCYVVIHYLPIHYNHTVLLP
jgi:hypothetical protein